MPCVNIHRLPIGGRNFESYGGEDPFLASRMAVAYISGIQSTNIIPSIKHFALNNQEWSRNNVDVIVSERAMREIYLPAFEAAVREADVWCVMSSYNLVNGLHTSASKHLLTDILKNDWGFHGFVVSDWGGVHEAVACVNAGQDVEMSGPLYYMRDSLLPPIHSGIIPQAIVDDAVRRVLRVRFVSGMMDRPANAPRPTYDAEAHRLLARKAGEEGVVLLKNSNAALPIDLSKVKSIAVIGPNAAFCRSGGGGSAYVPTKNGVSPLDGIKNKAGAGVRVEYALGDSNSGPVSWRIAPAYFYTDTTLAAHGLKAEYFNNLALKGPPVAAATDSTIDFDWGNGSPNPAVITDSFTVRWTGVLAPDTTRKYKITGWADDGIRLFINDTMLLDGWRMQRPTDYLCDYTLYKGRRYRIRVEFCDIHGGATVRLHWDLPPKSSDRSLIADAAKVAKNCDVALVFVGATEDLESEERDRDGLELPFHQDELIAAVAAANPRTIVVITGGTPVIISKWINQVAGLVQAFFLGQETGNILSDILFGAANPSGKLPFSYIADYSQSPAFGHYRNPDMKAPYDEGIYVGYRYLEKNKLAPSFPFGFGLSYTKFSYSNLKINKVAGRSYRVLVDIQNTGSAAGDEIVQLYVTDLKSSIDRPLKELKGFARVSLAPGRKKTTVIGLDERSFAYFDAPKNVWTVEPGEFEILVGASSGDIRCRKSIRVE
jgi:beta-glucosidase